MHKAEARRWLEQAEWDLKAGRDSRAAGNHEWACFQAQQSAEKALKSFLFAAGKTRMITHSVRQLLVACEALDPACGELRPAAELDQYYVPTRYPNGLPDDVPHDHYTAEAAERCLSLATSVLAFVKRSSAS